MNKVIYLTSAVRGLDDDMTEDNFEATYGNYGDDQTVKRAKQLKLWKFIQTKQVSSPSTRNVIDVVI
jgi:hypothetical protein